MSPDPPAIKNRCPPQKKLKLRKQELKQSRQLEGAQKQPAHRQGAEEG